MDPSVAEGTVRGGALSRSTAFAISGAEAAQRSGTGRAVFARRHSNNVIVAGFTDERGTADYNRALGEKRAGAVREALIADGVDASQACRR